MSTVQFNKVAIVGAGAIGGWVGVHLARAGAQLSVLARGDTLSALQKNGQRGRRGHDALAAHAGFGQSEVQGVIAAG